jgi:hypothetical protein
MTGSAPEKCKELVGLFCGRAVECTPSDAGTPEAQKESCVMAVSGSLNCDAATAIGDTYATCTKEMPAIDCAKFASNASDVLPQSCRGVVQSPAPQAPPAAQTTPPPTINKSNIILGRASSNGPFDTYLGCLCDESDPDSVISPVGAYGSQSKFSTNSIWNRYGTFGSDYSSQSACNRYAFDPPVVVNNGQIVGRLTRNQFASGAITDPAVVSLLAQQVCVN